MLECDSANMIAMAKLASNDNRHTISDWVKSPVYTVLIEHPEGLVLFDTGCNPEAMNGRWDAGNVGRTPYTFTENERLLTALKKLGYAPDNIDYVVLSHLHEDHAGCLEYFTRSKIFVNDFELSQTLKLYALNGEMGGYIRNDIHAWLERDIHWELVEDDVSEVKLFDRVTILNFGPGHAFGMMGLLVELPNSGNIILAADAINTSVNYGPPIRYPGLAYDTIGYYKTIRRIKALAREKKAQVWFGHDIDQFLELRKAPDFYYD